MYLTEDNKNEQSFCHPPYSRKAFTLSEVLITLVIIGIISAITVPSVIQTTQDNQFKSKFKKAYSILNNAIRKEQVFQGLSGDNRAIFNPENSSYQSALNLSKNLNTIAVCDNGYNYPCRDYYYSIAYADKSGTSSFLSFSRIILSDGAHILITQYPACPRGVVNDYFSQECALLYIDVNGAQGPNKFGKDCFDLRIGKDSIFFGSWAPTGGNQSKILYK